MAGIGRQFHQIKSVFVDANEVVGICELKDETTSVPYCTLMLRNGKAIAVQASLDEVKRILFASDSNKKKRDR